MPGPGSTVIFAAPNAFPAARRRIHDGRRAYTRVRAPCRRAPEAQRSLSEVPVADAGGERDTAIRDRTPIATTHGEFPAQPLTPTPPPRPRHGACAGAPARRDGRAAAWSSGALERELASAAPEGRDVGPSPALIRSYARRLIRSFLRSIRHVMST